MAVVCKRIDVIATKLTYMTSQAGEVLPIFAIEPFHALDELDQDALIFDSFREIEEGANVGTVFTLDFHDENPKNMTVIKMEHNVLHNAVHNKESKAYSEPKNCTTCTAKLNKSELAHEYKMTCSNIYCPATSRGAIHMLLDIATNFEMGNLHKLAFLDDFAMGADGPGRIDAIGELHLALNPETKADKLFTQSRAHNWRKIHGHKLGTELWEFEIKILKFLQRTSAYNATDFWYICNFKLLNDGGLVRLHKVNPRVFLNPVFDADIIKDLSVEVRTLLNVNMDFIAWLIDFFDAYKEEGVKTVWTT